MYQSLGIHRAMLRDHPRNEAYRQALRHHVKPHHVVLDVGAGSGILSLFAAQAGARRVYAVERTDIAHLARRLIAANNFNHLIQVIEREVENIVLPEKVDVIVSEWLGTIGVDENFLAAVVTARDRWLKPGGVMLPEIVTAMIAPAYLPALEQEIMFWHARPYNLDLSIIGNGAAQEFTWTNSINGTRAISDSHTLEKNNHHAAELLARGQPMWTTDAYQVTLHEANLPSRASLKFYAEREGRCNAFVAWFVADFGANITLSTALDAPPTHWRQYVYPLDKTVMVKPADEINVEATCLPFVPGYSHQAWSARIGKARAWEHHDTRRVVWLE